MTTSFRMKRHDLQIEALVPDGVQFLRHGPGAFLHFAHLDGHVRIRRAALIFGY